MQDRKLFFPLAAALALSAGFTSCSSEDDVAQRPNGGRTPITLASSVATRSIDQNLQNVQLAGGVKVGVYAQANSEYIENGDNNMLTADGAGAFTGATMYYPEEGGVSIYAYAPYNSAWAGGLNAEQTFTVPADQSTDNGYLAADLMTATPSNGNPVAPTTETVQLNFTHKLAKINVNFNTGNSGVSLQGATVGIMNVLPTTTVNVSTGAIGNAQGSATTLTAATFAAGATTFTASAIFVPQTILSGTDFVQVSTADGKDYVAQLNRDVAFESGKRYTYTMQFNGGGDEPVTAELVLGSVVDDWEDGNEDIGGGGEETVVYGVGDYLLGDGTFVKNADLTSGQYADVVAVVFSTQVSQADADAGYNAYAMGVERFGNKGWQFSGVAVGEVINNYAGAYADLDGLSKTNAILASDAYATIPAENVGSSFVNYANYSVSHPLNGDVASTWFTPSFGQMVQIFNNLGGAGLAEQTEVHEGNYSSPVYYSADKAVLDNINAYVTKLGKSEMFLTEDASALVYLTVTEQSETGSWCFMTRNVTVSGDDTVYAWGFGRGGGKANGGRSVSPCVAVKLPAAQ